MPPDDPLGRHGPSLENFLRKRPVVPEHRKQPCPYGNDDTRALGLENPGGHLVFCDPDEVLFIYVKSHSDHLLGSQILSCLEAKKGSFYVLKF